MKRLVLLLTLFLSLTAAGQVQVSSQKIPVGAEWGRPHVNLNVRDSLTREHLVGAAVFFSAGKDTLKRGVTDGGGFIWVDTGDWPPSDVVVTTSYLGYKTRRDTIRIESQCRTFVTIGMQEDPMQLNALIIKADAIAMVMHGDTTVFNPAAFTTMKGDVLRDLLRKLPGVEVGAAGVTYQGKAIDRILFNGQNLFGKEMKDAMDMVLSSEVKDIKVYDRKAVDDDGTDELQAKEHVMDVRTWKPLRHVGQLSADLTGGTFFSRDRDDKRPFPAGADISGGSYTQGGPPRLSFRFEGLHNMTSLTPTFSVPSQQPADKIAAQLNAGKDTPGKMGWTHFFSFRRDDNRSSSGRFDSYHPTELWAERRDSTLSDGYGRSEQFSYTGTLMFSLKKGRFRLFTNAGAGRQINRSRAQVRSFLDGTRTGYDRMDGDTVWNGSVSVNGEWVRRLSKKGRLFSLHGSVKCSLNDGHGARVDTLPGTMSREWLTNTRFYRIVSPSLSSSFTEPLGGKDRLRFSVSSSYSNSLNRSDYINVFTGAMDMNLSQDVRSDYLGNTAAVSWEHGRWNDGFAARLDLGVRDILTLRDERLGNVKDWSKNYVRPVILASVNWSSDVRSLELLYDESETVPTASQLRNVLDDSNPLFLSAGNPDLVLPVRRRMTLRYARSFAKYNINCTLKASGNLLSRSIASKTVYFPSATYLEEFDYQAPAGSCLVTPVNLSGNRDGQVEFLFDQYLSRIRTKYCVTLTAGADKRPFYLADVLHTSGNRSFSALATVFPGGEFFQLSLTAGLTATRCIQDGIRQYDSFGPSVNASWTQRYGQHVETNISAGYSGMTSTREGMGYDMVQLNAYAAWLFGKDNRCRLSLTGSNLIGMADGWSSSVTENYLRINYQNLFGPSLCLSFRYVFSRR